MYEIVEASSEDHIKAVKNLFLEYARWLDFPLCFQGFDEELSGLPGKYTPPEGRLYLVLDEGKYTGCIGLRRFEGKICEMKRLYVKPAYRGKGIGNALIQKITNEAKAIGYRTMRLDTIRERMRNAVTLYEKHGFLEIDAYYDNPNPHTLYMELKLS